jgi:hypothetical protein
MNLLIGLVIGGILLAVLEQKHIGIVAGISDAPPLPVISPPPFSGQIQIGGSVVDQLAGPSIRIGVQAGEQVAEGFAQVGSNLAKAIPIVGSIVGAIAGSLLAAHQRRLREATDENSAVNKFIADMDGSIATIGNAYNRGQLSGYQAAQYFEQLWQHYWAEVTPHIQPERNGCNGGASIPRSRGGDLANSACGGGVGWSAIANKYKCSGDWGAACCVGGAVIEGTISNLKYGAMKADSGARGNRVSVRVCQTFASQYGGRARAAYTVTFQKP